MTSSTKSSRKPIKKVSSDSSAISFDLVSNLTYMAAIASGGPERDVILEWTPKQDYQTVVFFHQVSLLTKKFGFEYARAYRMVARKAKADSLKNLFLRFAGAISSGVNEVTFLAEEARVEREQYINSYYRSLEALIKWGDAYAALLVSVALIVVVAMMSTMLSNLGSAFVIMLTGVMSLVSAFGVYIIFRIAPSETTTYMSRHGPKERRWAKRLIITVAPAGFLLGAVLGFSAGFHLFSLLFGISLLPAGIMAFLDNGKISKRDQEIAPFLRSLGNVTASTGTTTSVSLGLLDRRSLATLEPTIRRLQIRLRKGISPDKSWEAFRDEAGSLLLSRATRMFVDGVQLGGPPEKVGALAAEYATDSALMRSRRAVSAAPFAFLVIPLHFAMTGLMVFVLEIMRAFNFRIAEASADLEKNSEGSGLALLPSLPVFQPQDISMLTILTLVALLTMTIANALAPKFAVGGHPLTLALFAGLTCIMTGFNMMVIPPISVRVMLREIGT